VYFKNLLNGQENYVRPGKSLTYEKSEHQFFKMIPGKRQLAGGVQDKMGRPTYTVKQLACASDDKKLVKLEVEDILESYNENKPLEDGLFEVKCIQFCPRRLKNVASHYSLD